MFARLLLAPLAALAILAAPAAAQDPTPTPTPTPEPAAERSDEVKAVYRDYRRDGGLDSCKHERATLRETLEDLDPQADVETPDLRPLLEAALAQHRDGGCDEAETDPDPDTTDGAAGTGTTGGGTGSGTTITPVTPSLPDTSSGTVAPSDPGGSSAPAPPTSQDVTPIVPEVTPVPPAPVPEAAPAPLEPTGPVAAPPVVYDNADDGVPLALLLLAGLLALLGLLALAAAVARRFGWGESTLAGPGRAWREAAFRAGGTWGDFADWIRVGR